MNILSTKNFKFKELRRLQKKKMLRDQQRIIIVEGKKEVLMALKKYRPHELFLYNNYFCTLYFIKNKFPLVIEICKSILKKISINKENEGIIATFHRHYFTIKELLLPKNPVILVLINLEKPGNLGAIIRSAEALGIDAIILSEIKTDIFHINVSRSSLGTIFIHNMIISQSNDIINWFTENKINVLATSTRTNTSSLYESKFQVGTAIIVGNEALGLAASWINRSNNILKIPMYGNIDSLNVSNAVAIILFEALRQRLKI